MQGRRRAAISGFRTNPGKTAAGGFELLHFWYCLLCTLVASFRDFRMRMLLNAVEDIKNRTLKAFPSLLEKLVYICSLRDKDGIYRHWGLEKAFGEQKANKALGTIHTEMSVDATRTPLREIYRQFEGAEWLNKESLVLNTPSSDDELLSDHLRLIQQSVVAIAEQESSNRPTS